MPHTSRNLLHGLTRTWLLIGLCLIVLTWWAGQRSWSTDAYVYDRLLTTRIQPPNDDILIVAIDERSLNALGQWPWPRDMHAALLDRLAATDISAVLFDVVFIEPSRQPDHDQRLADAIRRQGHTYLPIILPETSGRSSIPRYLLPAEPLRNAARGLGHIDIRADDDGTVRRIHLRGRSVPQLTLRLYEDLIEDDRVAPPEVTRHLLSRDNTGLDILIPYRGPTYHYPRVSYVDILEGRLPPSLLEDRIIMVGATAKGLGDRHPTPFGAADGGMPGVEIQANLLDGLLQGDIIRDVPTWLASIFSILPLLVFMGLVRALQFRHMAKLTLAVLTVIAMSTWGLLVSGWWWPPTISFGAVIAASILISWRCQATALTWFQQEIGHLENEPGIIPAPVAVPTKEWGLVLHRRLFSLKRAITRLRNTHRFISDAMDSMPIATLVVDMQGRIILSSAQAKQLLRHYEIPDEGSVHDLLVSMTPEGQAAGRRLETDDLGALDDQLYKGNDERHYRLKVSSLVTAVDAFEVGWLIGLVDVTSKRQAEEQRASLLRFLSHDLKAPQSSILALIQLQHSASSRLSEKELLDRVAQQARNALTLTDSFLQLTKIEFGAMEKEFVLLSDVILEAIDQAWPAAQQRGIRIEHDIEDECPMEGDRAYLLRAIFNLLDNAIKYSLPDTCISIEARETAKGIVFDIQDQGIGIPEQDLPHIFDSYQRSSGAHLSTGHGLGLSLVKSVIERHGGTIECQSTENVGTRFRLTLPSYSESPGTADVDGTIHDDPATT
ncbi:alginate biosynthesis sensor protein KinB [Halomonas elongata]|uniref:histidine kinase n=1 Tax=Halomonas elongata TaxID=2746 RepID=A0A1B8P5V1_HALEL|nr:CHASE2 domain-containing protein [Halomonas elongata]OBX37637.1 alginate biosynthesis sensor protein KinB [Halomonas elongata]